MRRTRKVSWLTTGSFSERVAKESLIIFPIALLFVYYYGFIRSGAIDFTLPKLLLYSSGLTLAIAAINARRPAPQPSEAQTGPTLYPTNE